MIDVKPSLKTVLKRLKLSGLAPTLPDRATYAVKAGLHPLDFLELALQDEIDRRERTNLSHRLGRAGFTEQQVLEDFDWDAPISFDRDRVRDLFGLGFLDRHEDVIFLGPVGVGKTFLATAIGHSACRAGRRVLFLRSDQLLKLIHQSRADNSTERVLRSLLVPDLLIVDDFGLRRLNAQQSSDFYEVIIERHRRASTIVTSNRAIDEWIPSSMTRSSHRARSTGLLTTHTRSSWRARATVAVNGPATCRAPLPDGWS